MAAVAIFCKATAQSCLKTPIIGSERAEFMFTHQPITPARLEVLIDLLRGLPRSIDRTTVEELLQPDGLPISPGIAARRETP
jgi:hypothetical protein